MSINRRRIVILTPGQLGSNPRVVKEANALHEAGYDTHVIATKVATFVEPRDQAVLQTALWSYERVAFNGRILWRGERLIQETARLARAILPSARLTSYANSAFARRISAAAMSRRADLYIAHYVAALEGAARAAAHHDAQFAFDAEDFHPGELPDQADQEAKRSLVAAIEARRLPHAAYITAASPGIAHAYADEYGLPEATVVNNVFPLGQAPASASVAGTAHPAPSLYWFSQTIGPDRGLECAVRAVAAARTRPHLYLRGTPSQGYLEALRALASQVGVANRLHILPPANPEMLEQLASAYDLGLVGETGATTNRRIALTNKQFSYLLAGIPAVMSDVPAHVEFAAEAKGAAFLYRTEDHASLANVLDTLLGDPERLALARARAFTLGQERFNWDIEKNRLLECVRRALNRSGQRAHDEAAA